MRRPEVNLDRIAAALDRAIEHPATKIAEEFFPDTVHRLRQVRQHLPEIASGVEAKGVEAIKAEARSLARDLEREFLGGLGRFIDETLVAHGKGPPKRLRAAPKRKRRKR
jgi:hypothetical protein